MTDTEFATMNINIEAEEVTKLDSTNIAPEEDKQNENGNEEASFPTETVDKITVTKMLEAHLGNENVIHPEIMETGVGLIKFEQVGMPHQIDKPAEILNDEIKTEEGNDKTEQIKSETFAENNTTSAEKVQAVDNPIKSESVTENVTEAPKLVNPLKRKRCRPLKRKRKECKPKIHRVMKTSNKVSPKVTSESDLSIDTSSEIGKEDVEYCLTVSNLPNSWSFMDIKNYIDTECGPVDEIEMIKDDQTGKGAIKLSYQTEEECKESIKKLKDKEVAGNKLTLEMTVVSLESDSESQSEASEANKKPWKPDLDSWELDPQGMYGLKLQYLRSLGITPPLDKWVHVSNFRCDKSELRDVMEMAGNVQMCAVFTANNRYANVMYTHPLEAVQAVSMLNNQLFYGQRLKVAMDISPVNTILLPKGLTNIGKGLGLYGKPLRNIVKHYKRFVEDKDCLIDPAFFDIPANHSMRFSDGFCEKFEVKSVEEFNYPIADKADVTDATKAVSAPVKSIPPKPIPTPTRPTPVQKPAYVVSKPVAVPPRVNFTPQFQQHAPFQPNFRPAPFAGPQNMMNGQGMRPQGPPGNIGSIGPPGNMGNMGPPGNMGNMGPPGNMGNMGPPMPMVQSGPRMNPSQFAGSFGSPGGPGPRPVWGLPGPVQGPQLRPGHTGSMFPNEPVKLILSNLPPSTTFALLCEKMSEWGHVVCIQLTTPGCAVVTFATRIQADGCYKHYNGRNIENHYVQVKYA